MQQVLTRPTLWFRLAVPVMVVMWFLSGLARNETPSAGGMKYRVGATAWATFLITFGITLLFTLAVLGYRVLRRKP